MNGFKTFIANVLGGAVGTALYVFVTSTLAFGGVNLASMFTGMVTFGLVFGLVAAVRARFGQPTLLSDFACGTVTVALLGTLIMGANGFAYAAALLSPLAIVAMLVFAGLIGTGGHLAKKLFASK